MRYVFRYVRRIVVATIVVFALLCGGAAHRHASTTAAPEQCTACALTQATPDAPLAILTLAAPPAEAPAPAMLPAAPAPRATRVLDVAPKTSPPRLPV